MIQRKRFLIVDGNSLIHRGFHAIPHLSTKAGEPVNGVYGFALLFLKALKELKPDYAAVAFDLPEPTFREKIYEPYKATRIKAPAELYVQIPRVKQLVESFNLPIYELPGYEADDLLGALAEQIKKEKDLEVIILTGDLDTLQLVEENVKVFAPKTGLTEVKLYDKKAILERYGLKPEQLVDFKALRGDPSDNIPGVKGIGEKTAIELLQRFGNLERIYEYLSTPSSSPPPEAEERERVVKPRIKQLLLEHKKEAEVSKRLVQLVKNLSLELDLNKARLSAYDEAKVVKFLQEMQFSSLIDKLPKSNAPQPSLKIRGGEGELNYELIDTKEKQEKFLEVLKKQKQFAIDTETTSLRPLEAELLGIGFCWEKGRAYYLPNGGLPPKADPPLAEKTSATLSNDVTETLRFPELKLILENRKIKKIGHNIKYDYLVLKQSGINLQGIKFDTMVAAYLLNPGARNFDLDTLAFNEFGFRKTPIKSLIGEGKKQICMSEVPLEKVARYCCEDADFTWRLSEKLRAEIREKKLEKIFLEIEIPLIQVLAEMEYWGIKITPEVLQKLSREATIEVGKLQQKIWRLSGEKFNIGSPIQLKQILFEKLDIPTEELKKGKTGLSTAASELEKLRSLHPIIDLIFDWRELTKLQNTYLNALPQLINPKTGRVHTSFNQTITATGRLSSSDPNLQNIPIRTELGREIRQAFIAEKGFKFVSVDYSQIELRLAAHLSGDEKMLKVFHEGGDIHTATAQEIFGLKNPEEVTPEQRRDAKTINFGVLYGLSAYGLKSRISGVSQVQAQEFIDKYFATYQGLTLYLEKILNETRETGYVKNEIGRFRFLPEINSSQFQVRGAAERAAINMPFQSLSADIIKMAMNKLVQENLTSREDCRLLLQVHDELVFEIAEDKVEEHAVKIAKIMSGIYKLKVPLVVEAKSGDNWEEMEKFAS